MTAPYAVLAIRAWWMTWLALVALLVVIAGNTLIAPTGGREPNWIVFFVWSLPLLIMLPGAWRSGISSFTWLSFISLLYFAQAVLALAAPQPRWLDGVHLLASIALFIGALLFVRWRARANRAAMP